MTICEIVFFFSSDNKAYYTACIKSDALCFPIYFSSLEVRPLILYEWRHKYVAFRQRAIYCKERHILQSLYCSIHNGGVTFLTIEHRGPWKFSTCCYCCCCCYLEYWYCRLQCIFYSNLVFWFLTLQVLVTINERQNSVCLFFLWGKIPMSRSDL